MNQLYLIISKINTILIRLKRNISIGCGSSVFYKSSIINHSKGFISIGKNTLIGRSKRNYHGGMPFYTTLLNNGENSNITIGNNCRINGAYIHAEKSIRIGDNCVFASGITIVDSNGHETVSLDRTKGRDIPQEIVIGNNVWIGMNSIILKGTKIGDNCIVAAGSVIKGEFDSNTIISSNKEISCRKIRQY